MNYKLKCSNINDEDTMEDEIKDETSNTNLCENMWIKDRELEFNRSIEFISNSNPLLGFFVIEPALLYLDSNYFRVYYHDT